MTIACKVHRWFAGLLGAAVLASGSTLAAPGGARQVGSFDAVSVRAPVEVELRQAAAPRVEVRAEDAVQPLIETVVVDGAFGRTLDIRVKAGAKLPWPAKVRVVVDVASLRGLAIAGSGDVSGSGLKLERLEIRIGGSGDVRLNDLQAGQLELNIAGSGDIALSGRTDRLTASIAGSGDIDASALDAQDVSLRIAGSGDAQVRAATTLDVTIAGSGEVTYAGQPRLTQRILGSGSLVQR